MYLHAMVRDTHVVSIIDPLDVIHSVVTRPSITPAFLSGLNDQLERVSHFSG